MAVASMLTLDICGRERQTGVFQMVLFLKSLKAVHKNLKGSPKTFFYRSLLPVITVADSGAKKVKHISQGCQRNKTKRELEVLVPQSQDLDEL